MISLLDPIQIGEIHLPNRVIMSPLTRLRGTPEHIPTQLMADYMLTCRSDPDRRDLLAEPGYHVSPYSRAGQA